MYIVHLNPIGFIILSSVDRTIPILGYSYHSEININELPRQLEAILISYQVEEWLINIPFFLFSILGLIASWRLYTHS